MATDEIRPGDPLAQPELAVEPVLRSRRFVRCVQLFYETIDGRVIVSVTVVDLGDPRAAAGIDIDGWRPFGKGALGRALGNAERSSDRFPQRSLLLQRGSVVVEVMTLNRSQAVTGSSLEDTVARVGAAFEDRLPALPPVAPARPVSPAAEALAVATALATQVLLLVWLRWLFTAPRDRPTRRRVRAWFDRGLGRRPPGAERFTTDVTAEATAHLWAVRVVGAIRLVLLVVTITVVSAFTVLWSSAYASAVVWWRVLVLVGPLVVAWIAVPRLSGVLCRVFSGGRYRPSFRRRTPGPSRWLHAPFATGLTIGGYLLSMAMAAVAFGLVLFGAVVDASGAPGVVGEEAAQDVTQSLTLLGGLVLLVASLPFMLARRMAQRSTKVALAEDRARPKVLLLRSFADDGLKLRAHWSVRHHLLDRMTLSSRRRFEELLAWSLWRTGPVTAIGQPGARLPPLGAAREYYADDVWTDAAAALIEDAALIVMVLDRTDALAWEIAQLRARGALERTLFVVPPVAPADRCARLTFLEDRLGIGRVLSALDSATEVLVARVPHPGGIEGPHAWTARFADDLAYEIALEDAAERAYEVQPPRASDRPVALARPAPRGARPRARAASNRSFAVAAALFLVNALLSNGLGALTQLPDAPTPAKLADLRGHVDQVEVPPSGVALVGTGRRDIAYSEGDAPGANAWQEVVPADDRLRAVELANGRVAYSTLETDEVVVLDQRSGDELATVPMGESAGSIALSPTRVAAALPERGVVRIVDIDGGQAIDVPIDGVPTRVDAAGEVIVVLTAFDRRATMIDPDLEVRSVELGEDLRGLATTDDLAYVLSLRRSEVFAVDVASGEVVASTQVQAATALSAFDANLAIGEGHLALATRQEGVPGVAVLTTDPLEERHRFPTWPIGGTTKLAIARGSVIAGSVMAPGMWGWPLDPEEFPDDD